MITDLNTLERVRKECRSMVTKRSLASAAAAAVPVPGVDLATDVALMMEVIPAISRRFGLAPEQLDELDPLTRQRVAVMVTSVGSRLIGTYVTTEIIVALLKRVGITLGTAAVAKYVPIIGTAVASTLSFGVMRHLGNSHINDCHAVVHRLLTEPDQA